MRIFPVIRKVMGRLVGGSNTRSDVKPGIAVSQRFDVRHGEPVDIGVAVSQGPISARIPQTPGVSVTPRAEGDLMVSQSPGVALGQRLDVRHGSPVLPALEIVQVRWDLTKRDGASSVAESAVGGRTDWASDANALGLNNGSVATFAGNLTGARGGRLDLSYADVTGKSDLVISLVELLFYGQVAGTVLNNADVRLEYALGGAVTTLETITGNADFRSAPKTHNITAAIGGDWSKVNALTTHVRADAAAAETWTAEVDAVLVRVLATVTDPL